MRGEILGLERRRRWSDDEKLAIVRSIGVDGLTVTQVAQRYDLKRQQLYAWRHDLKRRGLLSSATGTMFLPVGFLEADLCHQQESHQPRVAQDDRVEVVLRNGRSLRVVGDVNVATLVRLMNAVEAS
jgi:transposase